jgi:hypothetical protein
MILTNTNLDMYKMYKRLCQNIDLICFFWGGSVLAKLIKKADQEPLGFEQQMSVEAMPPKNERAKEKQWR